MTGRKREPERPWWETGIGSRPTTEETERRKATAAAHERSRQHMRFQFWKALREFFDDGAPPEWTYALILVHFQSDFRCDPRIEIIGPRAGPPYSEMSERFLEAFSDLEEFRQEYGKEHQLGSMVKFALNRVDRWWSVALNPEESQLREWLQLLGYDDSSSESRRALRVHSGRDTAAEE